MVHAGHLKIEAVFPKRCRVRMRRRSRFGEVVVRMRRRSCLDKKVAPPPFLKLNAGLNASECTVSDGMI